MTTPSTMQLAVVSPDSLESVTPENPGSSALTDRAAETKILAVTQQLPPVGYKVPMSLDEVLSGGGSAAGFSAVSSWLTCPEQARLRSSGVRLRQLGPDKEKLDALTFGTIAHAMRAVRLVYGHTYMLQWFWAIIGMNIPRPDADKLDLMFSIYESIWPWGFDQWLVIGVEVEVVTDIAAVVGPSALTGGSMLRTVRYDTVIQHPDGGVYSFEAKTAARSSQLEQYNPQGMVQTAIWNSNPWLVQRYGQMRGVLFDEYVKTETPKVERIGPKYYSIAQQRLALRYMALPDALRYPVEPLTGRYPQMLHACWGKYAPCSFIPLCHEEAFGMYEYENGEDYIGG